VQLCYESPFHFCTVISSLHHSTFNCLNSNPHHINKGLLAPQIMLTMPILLFFIFFKHICYIFSCHFAELDTYYYASRSTVGDNKQHCDLSVHLFVCVTCPMSGSVDWWASWDPTLVCGLRTCSICMAVRSDMKLIADWIVITTYAIQPRHRALTCGQHTGTVCRSVPHLWSPNWLSVPLRLWVCGWWADWHDSSDYV